MEIKIDTKETKLTKDQTIGGSRRLEYESGLIIVFRTLNGEIWIDSNYNWLLEPDGSRKANYNSLNKEFKDVI